MFKKQQPKGGETPLPQGVQDAQYAAVPGGKGGAVRALCAFLAFVLGVSLVVEGMCFFAGNLSTSNGRQWWKDSFQEDYQNTRQFQSYVEDYLGTLLAIGSGGPVNRWYGGYDDTSISYGTYESIESIAESTPVMEEEQRQYYKEQAQEWHQWHREDKNMLYQVRKGGLILYKNADDTTVFQPTQGINEGYTFLLTFDGKKVCIWKNGEEVDVYGDGYYKDGSGQWYVPGYQNFQAGEDVKDLRISIAILGQPRQFMLGNYGKSGGAYHYNQLYDLQQGLTDFRETVVRQLIGLGAGVLLLAVYVLLRRDKARADRFLARGTGKVWFEVKLVLLIVLAVWQLPRLEYFNDILAEVTYAYSGEAIATMISESAGWMLRDYLLILPQHSGQVLFLFWAFYLLLFNDWRYNRHPWKHGLISGISQLFWGLTKKISIEKRLTALFLVGPTLAVSLLFLMLVTVGPILMERYGYRDVEEFYSGYMGTLALACAAAAALTGVCYWQGSRFAKDMGEVSKQISGIRAGCLEQETGPIKTEDMRQLSDDLNHIQQGLHQAVEERTRSERMKVELVTNVSHDLKTPLTSIISYTELLAQEPLEPPASEYVQILGEKAQRLKTMVQDVFEVSKAASGQLPVKLEQLDFGRLLRQTLADMDAAISQSGLTLRVSIPERPIHITADSDRMYRVFQNLIGNALKYSLPGSRVYLTLNEGEGWAAASVKNTSAAELDPSADYAGRFVRGDSSRTDGGSGLGLSIADSFTRACGGELTITTEADLFTASVRFPTGEPKA